MYDQEITIRQGAIQALYAEIELDETAVVQPGGTFTLYGADGAVLPGFNGVTVSGYEHGPERRLRVWYLLDTGGLAAGVYTALFRFQAQGDEGLIGAFEADLKVSVAAAVEVVATYTESLLAVSPLFQTRLHAGDTDVANAIWSDAELSYFLTASGGVAQLAAAQALESLALDRAKLANAVRIGAYGNGEAQAYRAIAERAARLRAVAPTLPAVDSPDRVFIPSTLHGRRAGNMKDW